VAVRRRAGPWVAQLLHYAEGFRAR
jgi:hypothetical protein